MDPDLLLAGLRAGKTAALARAISVVENGRPGFERLLAEVHRSLGRARRIGITGPPGAGKSTLVERLVSAYRAAGLTVAVVAVDPTSPFTGGALLGDRIRMESVALDQGVYIRSMAHPRLARRARHDHARGLRPARCRRLRPDPGRDGRASASRSSTSPAWPTPPCSCWSPSRATGSRRSSPGVMEIADIFVVNKADRPGAEKLRQEIEVTLGIRRGNAFRNMPAHHGVRSGGSGGQAVGRIRTRTERATGRPSDRRPGSRPVLLTVAAKGEGIAELVAALDRHHAWLAASGDARGAPPPATARADSRGGGPGDPPLGLGGDPRGAS